MAALGTRIFLLGGEMSRSGQDEDAEAIHVLDTGTQSIINDVVLC